MIGKRVNFFAIGGDLHYGTVTGPDPDKDGYVLVDVDGTPHSAYAAVCKVLPTPDEWVHPDVLKVAMHEQLKLSCIDKLTAENIAELKRINEVLDPLGGHPMWLTFDALLKLDLDACPDWVAGILQEKSWSWAWWADHFGESLENHVTRFATATGSDRTISAAAVEYVDSTRPYPAGWLPETRR